MRLPFAHGRCHCSLDDPIDETSDELIEPSEHDEADEVESFEVDASEFAGEHIEAVVVVGLEEVLSN